MGTLNVKGLGTFTVPDSFGQLSPEEQQKYGEELVAHVRGGSAGAQTSAPPPAPTTNIFTGIKQEAEATVGGLANSLASGRSAVQSHILGNPADDPATAYVRGVGKSFNDAAAATGYDDGTLDSAYDKGGIPGAASHAAKAFVVNAPHTVASLFAPTRALDFASNLQRNAEERARNDGRTDGPGFTDYAAAVPAAGVQELASMVGARALVKPAAEAAEGVVVPGVRAALARIGKATATDAATGAVGSEAQYLGTHAGTQAGATPEGAVSSAMEGGAAGFVGGAGVRSGIEAVNRIPTDRTAARGLKGEAIVAKQGEEQSASDMRVAQMAEQVRKSADAAGTGGMVPQDSNAYKTVQGSLIQKLHSTVDDLSQSGQIDQDERRNLIGQRGSLLDEAAVHNRVFGQDHLDRIDRMDLGDDVKQALRDGFRDLNTSTYNAMYKNGTGPMERVAKRVAYPVATGVAGAIGLGGALHGAGMAGLASGAFVPTIANGVKAAGRGADYLLGNRTPPAEASLTALRAAALKRQSLADASQRDTHGALETIRQDVEQKRLAAKQKAADDATAKITTKPPLPPSVQAIKDAAAEDRPFSKLSSSYLQSRARSLLKERADQQEAASKEASRQRLMGSVDTGAPAMGGFQAETLKSYKDNGVQASLDHLLEAVDNINRRGGFSSPEEYQLARAGVRFPNHGDGLSPLFREMDAVLKAKGVGATQDSRAATKADAAIVRAKTKAIVEAAMPKAPSGPTGVPSVANANQRPPQAPPRPRGPRKSPGDPAKAPPSTTGFEEGRRLHAYAATTFRAKMAEEQAIRSAGNRLDLQETASHIAGLEHKDAKAQAYEEALKKFHGDAEALRFVMGPLRTLAGIGGKSEQTANQKAVIQVRSKKTSK